MLRLAGQTAGPIGLKFFVDTQGWPGSVKGYKTLEFFFQKSFNIFTNKINTFYETIV